MNKQINQTTRIKATVISPLSIGQGQERDWVEGLDYLWDDGYLYHLDMARIAKTTIPLHKLSAFIADRNLAGIRNLLLPQLDNIYDFGMEMPVRSDNPVKTFYFNPITQKYVLFGSSLKGALRSAVFHYLAESVPKSILLSRDTNPNEFIFGKLRDGSDFMRFIKISDFDFEETTLVNSKIYNLHLQDGDWSGGWKHGKDNTNDHFKSEGFNTIYECLTPSTVAEGSFMFSPLLYELSPIVNHNKKKDFLMGLQEDTPAIVNLFQVVNLFTLNYLKKEIAFFKDYPQGENSDIIIDSLKKFKQITTDLISSGSKACLIKMSAGSGFHSITGDWQYDDYSDTGFHTNGPNNGKKKYKSRRIACHNGNYSPMGFIQLSII